MNISSTQKGGRSNYFNGLEIGPVPFFLFLIVMNDDL